MPIDFIGAAFVHFADLPAVEYSGANGNHSREECYNTRYRRDRIDRGNAHLPDEVSRDNVVAKEHDIYDGHRQRACEEHGTKFLLTETCFYHLSTSPFAWL